MPYKNEKICAMKCLFRFIQLQWSVTLKRLKLYGKIYL